MELGPYEVAVSAEQLREIRQEHNDRTIANVGPIGELSDRMAAMAINSVLQRWLVENVGAEGELWVGGDIDEDGVRYFFNKEDHAAAFKLTWL